LKSPHKAANNVLLRLLRENHIQRSTAFQPYVYFGQDINMKKNSAKIGHFLKILDVYKEVKKLGSLEEFLVEPKFGSKGTVEPDVYCIYRKTRFFIEVQNTLYSEKVMKEKMERYVELFDSRVIDGKFPHVLIISDQRYALDSDYPFRIFQATSFKNFVYSLSSTNNKLEKERIN